MADAFDKMILPIFAKQPTPEAWNTLKDSALGLLSLIKNYPVAGFENVKAKDIVPSQLLEHATKVAQAEGLNSFESYQAFMKKNLAKGPGAMKSLMGIEKKLSLMEKMRYASTFLSFQNAYNTFKNKHMDLITGSGYTNVGELKNTLANILQYLISTFGTVNAGSPSGAGSSGSGSSGSGSSSGGSSQAGKKKGPAWLVPTLVLGSLGIVGGIVYKMSKKAPKKKRLSR